MTLYVDFHVPNWASMEGWTWGNWFARNMATRQCWFSTYTGTVTAASEWDGPAERKKVRPALPGSYEAISHQVGIPSFVLRLKYNGELTSVLHRQRLERAIGVIYRPQSERESHYFHAHLPEQFDAVQHIDETRAVEPLERVGEWEAGEVPETFPSAL
jgi:erythromycin esterase-like protein